MANAILTRTIEIVRGGLGVVLDDIAVERVAVGLFFTGVKLSTGHAGACAMPVKEIPDAVCCPNSVAAMPFPGKLRGRRAVDLLDEATERVGIRRTLGIGTLNALSQLANERRTAQGFGVVTGLDAFEAAEVKADETVVGAFVPFLKALRVMGARHWVLEKDPSVLKPHEMPFFREAKEAPDVVPEADVLIITGTTLANDTLGDLIALAKSSARIAVVGPTVTMIPDAFFERAATSSAALR